MLRSVAVDIRGGRGRGGDFRSRVLTKDDTAEKSDQPEKEFSARYRNWYREPS